MSKNVVVLDEVDFKKAIDEINIRIQAIDEYLGTDDVTKLSEQFVMRLPKKYIRTASHFKEKLAFIDNEVLRKNISYHFQLSDLNSYMLNRMHVWGVVRNLVVKFQVVNMGAIAEAILVSVTPKKCKTKNLRIAFLIEGNHISEELKSEIDWLCAKFASNCTTLSAANCTMVFAANCTTVSAHHGPLISRQTVPPVDNF